MKLLAPIVILSALLFLVVAWLQYYIMVTREPHSKSYTRDDCESYVGREHPSLNTSQFALYKVLWEKKQ